MKQSVAIQHYSKPEIQKELVRVSKDRELGIQFQGEKYGKRPDILQFPKEVEQLARRGATSFHISQERWFDPMQLSQNSTKREMDALRKGWDLIIDIDCPYFDYSTLAAETIIQALIFHGVGPHIKFSGNRGWHIAIPFEAFPEKVGKKRTRKIYQRACESILNYLRDFINDELWLKIKHKEGDVKKIVEKTGKKKEEFIKGDSVDICKLIDLDIALGKPRHLIRAPYSLHEKTSLVSLTIEPEQVSDFKKEQAKPENIGEINDSFLNPEKTKKGSASQLLIQALDRKQEEKEASQQSGQVKEIKGKIHQSRFPPCMKLIMEGLSDGRKRALFALLNMLKCCNWSWQEIEQKVKKWNQEENDEPLKTGYILSQLNWHRRNAKKVPPPNCKEYYQEIGVCQPDNICKKIKNPISYVKLKKSN